MRHLPVGSMQYPSWLSVIGNVRCTVTQQQIQQVSISRTGFSVLCVSVPILIMAKAVTLVLCVTASLAGLGQSKVDVHKKKEEKYITVSTEDLDDTTLYTSTSKLAQFC